MLVTMAEMLQEAQKNNYAVPAPNVWNEESTRAALLAAENCKSPKRMRWKRRQKKN